MFIGTFFLFILKHVHEILKHTYDSSCSTQYESEYLCTIFNRTELSISSIIITKCCYMLDSSTKIKYKIKYILDSLQQKLSIIFVVFTSIPWATLFLDLDFSSSRTRVLISKHFLKLNYHNSYTS